MIPENGLGGVRNRKQVKKTLVYSKQQRLDGLAFIMHESNRNCLEAVFHNYIIKITNFIFWSKNFNDDYFQNSFF